MIGNETVREIAFQAAGAASAAVMAKALDVVMPTEEIIASVNKILAEFGVRC